MSLSKEEIKRLVDKEMSGLHYGDYPLDRNVARYNAYVQHHHDAVNKARPEIVARAKKSRSLWKKLTLQKPDAKSYELTPEEKKRFPHVKSVTPTATTFDRDFRPGGHWKTAMVDGMLKTSGARRIARIADSLEKAHQGNIDDLSEAFEKAVGKIRRRGARHDAASEAANRGQRYRVKNDYDDALGGYEVGKSRRPEVPSKQRELASEVNDFGSFPSAYLARMRNKAMMRLPPKEAMAQELLDKLAAKALDKEASTYQVDSVKDEIDRIMADYEATRQANNRRGRERMQRESR